MRQALGDGELQGVESGCQRYLAVERFAEEKVDVLGHDDVAEDVELIALASEFERIEEDISCGRGVEVGFAVVAAEGDEVVVTLLLVSYEAPRHKGIL